VAEPARPGTRADTACGEPAVVGGNAEPPAPAAEQRFSSPPSPGLAGARALRSPPGSEPVRPGTRAVSGSGRVKSSRSVSGGSSCCCCCTEACSDKAGGVWCTVTSFDSAATRVRGPSAERLGASCWLLTAALESERDRSSCSGGKRTGDETSGSELQPLRLDGAWEATKDASSTTATEGAGTTSPARAARAEAVPPDKAAPASLKGRDPTMRSAFSSLKAERATAALVAPGTESPATDAAPGLRGRGRGEETLRASCSSWSTAKGGTVSVGSAAGSCTATCCGCCCFCGSRGTPRRPWREAIAEAPPPEIELCTGGHCDGGHYGHVQR
jgi:hypothetical protein